METTYESSVPAQLVLILTTAGAKVAGEIFGHRAALGRLVSPISVIPFLDILARIQPEASGGNDTFVGIPVWRDAGVHDFLVNRRSA